MSRKPAPRTRSVRHPPGALGKVRVRLLPRLILEASRDAALRQSTASFSQDPPGRREGPLLLGGGRTPWPKSGPSSPLGTRSRSRNTRRGSTRRRCRACRKDRTRWMCQGPLSGARSPSTVPAKWANSASRAWVVPVGVGGGRPGPAGVFPLRLGRQAVLDAVDQADPLGILLGRVLGHC